MSLYSDYLLPVMLDFLCGVKDITQQREKVVPQARGLVLEVGMGTGLNLPIYNEHLVDKIIGLDPSATSFRKAARRANSLPFSYRIPSPERRGYSASEREYRYRRIDLHTLQHRESRESTRGDATAYSSLTADCSSASTAKRPANACIAHKQRITPVWKRIVGGCHLDRDVPHLLREGGFHTEEMNGDYVLQSRLLKVASFQYWGVAHANES